MIKFDTFCLHLSCSSSTVHASGKRPFACGMTSQGGATLMQAKWIKLDIGLGEDTNA